jgi:hypothetical protein
MAFLRFGPHAVPAIVGFRNSPVPHHCTSNRFYVQVDWICKDWPTSGYRCAADKCLVDYFATIVTINLSDRAVRNKTYIARISIPHEGMPKLPRLGLCGCTAWEWRSCLNEASMKAGINSTGACFSV